MPKQGRTVTLRVPPRQLQPEDEVFAGCRFRPFNAGGIDYHEDGSWWCLLWDPEAERAITLKGPPRGRAKVRIQVPAGKCPICHWCDTRIALSPSSKDISVLVDGGRDA